MPATSPLLVNLFLTYAERYVRRHFHAFRLAGTAHAVVPPGAPAVVYLNHPSWWDPLACVVLARRFFPGRRHAVPMDAGALDKYPFFRRLGFFPVERGTRRGAAQFLRNGAAALADPGGALWVTAEGAFRDPRQRPVSLQPGLARLLHRAARDGASDGAGVVIPLALEYPFWQERTPELLARFGEPIHLSASRGWPLARWDDELTRRLERAMDELRDDALRQDPAAFETVVGGRAGVGGVYDLWRRAAASLRGRRFDPSHGSPSIRPASGART